MLLAYGVRSKSITALCVDYCKCYKPQPKVRRNNEIATLISLLEKVKMLRLEESLLYYVP